MKFFSFFCKMKFDILVNFIFLKNEKYIFSFFIFQYHDDTKRTRIFLAIASGTLKIFIYWRDAYFCFILTRDI